MAAQAGKEDEQVFERVFLEGSDRFAEQTGADDQDDVSHYDEENRKRCAVAEDGHYCFVLGPTLVLTRTTGECVDYEAAEEAAYNANDGGNWDGACRLPERNTSNENDSFQPLTQHNDERKSEQCPFSRTSASSSIYQRRVNTHTRGLTLDLSYFDFRKRVEA